jgi:hypothetical protein
MLDLTPERRIRPRAREMAVAWAWTRGVAWTCILADALMFCAGNARAEVPDTLWTRTYGGANIDVAYDVQQARDGGFIVTGYTRSYGAAGHNLWIFKTDPGGNPEWNQAFGGGSDDEGQAVCQTSDGGYVAAGWTQSSGGGGKDVWVVKVDVSGAQQWTQTFGGSSDDEAYAIRETTEGDLIIAGATSSYGTAGSRDLWLIRTDPSGNPRWTRNLGGYGSDGAWSVEQTSDGGFVLAGWTYSYGADAQGNAWLVKTDALGTMQWNQSFGGIDADRGYEARQTADGGYIMAGYTGSFGAGLYDLYLVKTDGSGSAQWTRTFGGTGRDYANDVVETSDGGYLAVGYTLSYGAGGDDVYLVRTDGSGSLQWSTTYGGSASDVGYAVANTSDGGYVVAGHTLSYGAGLHDGWVIRLAPEGPSAVVASSDTVSGLWVRPNPFLRTATIQYVAPAGPKAQLSILDAGGRLVRTIESARSGSRAGTVVWDGLGQTGRGVPPGVYWCRLEAGGLRRAVKIVRMDR